jgi:hypothetical protein
MVDVKKYTYVFFFFTVCRSVVEEIEYEIQKENPKKMIEVGGYRLDSTGNQKQKVVSGIKYAKQS